jgi:hypothetical protein
MLLIRWWAEYGKHGGLFRTAPKAYDTILIVNFSGTQESWKLELRHGLKKMIGFNLTVL